MSWDIFVQDLPQNAKSIQDIPSDFRPKPLGLTRSQVIATIKEIAPFVDFSDESRGRIESEGYCCIVVSLGKKEDLDGFVFHVYGGEFSSLLIATILRKLDVRALDPGSPTGLFDINASAESFDAWQRYRDQTLNH